MCSAIIAVIATTHATGAPVPRKDIIGKASLVYWPLPDIHVLPNWSGVFANIPSAP